MNTLMKEQAQLTVGAKRSQKSRYLSAYESYLIRRQNVTRRQ